MEATGGNHDWDFVDPPPSELYCPYCHQILREPMLTDCCGSHFCKECIEPLRAAKKPCPECNQHSFFAMMDKSKRRKILELDVLCPLKGRGCHWKGEVGTRDNHLDPTNEDCCEYLDVKCTYGCGEDMEKYELAEHLRQFCPRRPHKCEHCGLEGVYEMIVNKHSPVCPKYPLCCQNDCGREGIPRSEYDGHLAECPEQIVPCQFHHIGCEKKVKRKDMAQHQQEDVYSHLSLQTVYATQQLSERDRKLEELTVSWEHRYQQLSESVEEESKRRGEIVERFEKELAEKDEVIRQLSLEVKERGKVIDGLRKEVDKIKAKLSGAQRESKQDKGQKAATGSTKLPEGSDQCPLCLSEFTNPITTKCGHVFCQSCLKKALKLTPLCPQCKIPLRQITGNQPPGGTMSYKILALHLPGYEDYETIKIMYKIPGGRQTQEHPHPGQPYEGTIRVAYLPDNDEGKEVRRLLFKAFEAGLIFTIGKSKTSGKDNSIVWNGIHHQTNTHGGPQNYGYPDPNYLERVKADLAAKGIVPDIV